MEQSTQRRSARNVDTGSDVPITAADQIWFSGRTGSGAVLTGHYRGGRWLGTNLDWEILGTEGELRITGTDGSLQTQSVSIAGARSGDTALVDLPVPATYTTVRGLDDPVPHWSPPTPTSRLRSTCATAPGVRRRGPTPWYDTRASI